MKKDKTHKTHLTNLQLELLRLFQTEVDEKTLKEVRNLLKEYFARKAIEEADKIWAEKQFTNEDMDKILGAQK